MINFSLIKDIYKFAVKKRKRWLIPFAILLVSIAVIIVATQGSIVAPFIYTLF
tara:strand:+ start:321 stop:479 length:159 start_codon:yes stop_codon:yes gene_type:complete